MDVSSPGLDYTLSRLITMLTRRLQYELDNFDLSQ